MTREMDVRTETLYILRGGKNIMYYTLLRRASLTLSLSLLRHPPPTPLAKSFVTEGRRAPPTAASFAWILEKKVRNFMQAVKRGCNISVQGARDVYMRELGE